MDKSLSKLYLFNLDNLLTVVNPLYSDTDRPAKSQQGIIRSLVLMLDFNEHSITNWAPKVASDRLLCAVCGFEFGKAQTFPSYYDLIKRLWRASRMDIYPTYKLLQHYSMIPFIPLDSNAKYPNEELPTGVFCFDDKSVPICMGGIPYKI